MLYFAFTYIQCTFYSHMQTLTHSNATQNLNPNPNGQKPKSRRFLNSEMDKIINEELNKEKKAKNKARLERKNTKKMEKEKEKQQQSDTNRLDQLLD